MKLLYSLLLLVVIVGCSHPLEISGEGDIVSASGDRDCSLEAFNAGQPNCTENNVSGAYSETYYAVPRPGWEFQ
ncbi:MAG: hypothetical protein AB8C02_17470, partial [Halioglobus sp.]